MVICTVYLLFPMILKENSNEFKMTKFPQLDEVASTTIFLDKPLNNYVGSKETGYSRDEFIGKIKIDYKKDSQEYLALLNKRGATSFEFDKHQFSVSLVNDDYIQIKKKIMDMPKGEDWVLMGPIIDRSMMRNYLAYQAAYGIMEYAPRIQYTELFVQVAEDEPEYIGLYMWTEKIRQGEERVNINPTMINQTETSFIIVKDEVREGDRIFNVYGKDLYMYAYNFVDVYPKTTLSERQRNYIGDSLTHFERVLYHDKYDINGEGYADFIDVMSFVDYYIINEFFMNTDAGHKSTFLYKDVRGPIYMGPVWDFNNAMGNVNTLFEMRSYKGLFMQDRMWFDRLLNDPLFAYKVVDRYKELRKGALSTQKLLDEIDNAYDVLKPFADRDHSIYQEDMVREAMFTFLAGSEEALFDYIESNNDAISDFDNEVKNLKEFITQRGSWLDENLESILKWTE